MAGVVWMRRRREILRRAVELDPENSHPYYGAREIHAAFATYAFSWMQFGAKLGFRCEYGERVVEVFQAAEADPALGGGGAELAQEQLLEHRLVAPAAGEARPAQEQAAILQLDH